MFNKMHLGSCSPALPLDYIIPPADRQSSVRSRLVAPRTTILLQGSSRDCAYHFVDGCVALFQRLADGRRQILDILGPGRVIGTGVTNLFPCDTQCLTFTQLRPLDCADPWVEQQAGDQLRLLLARSLPHATLLGRKTAQEKIASAILDLADQFARPARGPIRQRLTFTLHLTRTDLADWLGLALETVSRQLNSFKRGRLIDFKTPEIITIKDKSALSAIAAGQNLTSTTEYSGTK